jgi:hypothetical protein
VSERTLLTFKDFTLEIRQSIPMGETEIVLYDELYHDPIAVFTVEEFDAQLKRLAIEFGPKYEAEEI